MKLHELKLKTNYYGALSGIKTFELRKNDRDFQMGDLIHFVDANGKEIDWHEDNLYKITYILKNVPEYGLDKEYCILSLEKIKL